jgi:hypothetical protein
MIVHLMLFALVFWLSLFCIQISFSNLKAIALFSLSPHLFFFLGPSPAGPPSSSFLPFSSSPYSPAHGLSPLPPFLSLVQPASFHGPASRGPFPLFFLSLTRARPIPPSQPRLPAPSPSPLSPSVLTSGARVSGSSSPSPRPTWVAPESGRYMPPHHVGPWARTPRRPRPLLFKPPHPRASSPTPQPPPPLKTLAPEPPLPLELRPVAAPPLHCRPPSNNRLRSTAWW